MLGVPIDLVDLHTVLDRMERWIAQRGEGFRYVVCADSRVVMECRRNPSLKRAVESADLVLPDGMPLVWLARARGLSQKDRVTGSDVLLGFCERAQRKGYTSFFYGGVPGVAEELTRRLKETFPGLKVVGTTSPPFRPLTPNEDHNVKMMIQATAPDVVWVGLSSPKQEAWTYERQDKLGVPVAVCIGAAFDFCSGRVRRAPEWMQRWGLEWLHRLIHNPRRLWYRYLVLGPQFVLLSLREVLKMRVSKEGQDIASQED